MLQLRQQKSTSSSSSNAKVARTTSTTYGPARMNRQHRPTVQELRRATKYPRFHRPSSHHVLPQHLYLCLTASTVWWRRRHKDQASRCHLKHIDHSLSHRTTWSHHRWLNSIHQCDPTRCTVVHRASGCLRAWPSLEWDRVECFLVSKTLVMGILHLTCGRVLLSHLHCHSSTICNSTPRGHHNSHLFHSSHPCTLHHSSTMHRAVARCTAHQSSSTRLWVLWETPATRLWDRILTNLAQVLISSCNTRVLQASSLVCLAGLLSKLLNKDGNRTKRRIDLLQRVLPRTYATRSQ
jgi:hypothetical protein